MSSKFEEYENPSFQIATHWSGLNQAAIGERLLHNRLSNTNQPVCQLILSFQSIGNPLETRSGTLVFDTCQRSTFSYSLPIHGEFHVSGDTVLSLWTADFQEDEKDQRACSLKPFSIEWTMLWEHTSRHFSSTINDQDKINFSDGRVINITQRTFKELPSEVLGALGLTPVGTGFSSPNPSTGRESGRVINVIQKTFKELPLEVLRSRSLTTIGTRFGKTVPSSGQGDTSQVPCNFIKQGTCDAGAACRFSHDLTGTADIVCKEFEKGTCKFGSKCDNAHILSNGYRIIYAEHHQGNMIALTPSVLQDEKQVSSKAYSPVTVLPARNRKNYGYSPSQSMAHAYREPSWLHNHSPTSFRTALSSIGSRLSLYSTPPTRPGSSRMNFPRPNSQGSRLPYQMESLASSGIPTKVVESEYRKILRERSLLLSPLDELNWSGKGQHVEFSRTEKIPLEPLIAIGHGGSAIVDSVLCRRIKLARKTMTLHRRQKLETVLAEVEHLQRLRHSHIIQLVGSYILGRNFSILLYPVADFNLAALLERMAPAAAIALAEEDVLEDAGIPTFLDLAKFERCLSQALEFVHNNTTKHMDIKPQNVLVRRIQNSREWRVYLADFGISKHFMDDEMSKTDNFTPRSKIYCSPEVYEGESKGRSSDVFSLGCVFLEIETVLALRTIEDFVEFRSQSRDIDDPLAETFHDNLKQIRKWIELLLEGHRLKSNRISSDGKDSLGRIETLKTISSMIAENPDHRPVMARVVELLGGPRDCCLEDRESYEEAEMKDGRYV